MSLYGDYVNERKGYFIIEDDKGFATYGEMLLEDQTVMYIEEIYVKPEFRKGKQASRYADEISLIAKNKGIKLLLGSVDPNCNYSHESLLVLLGYGFKLYSAENNLIWFVKEI